MDILTSSMGILRKSYCPDRAIGILLMRLSSLVWPLSIRSVVQVFRQEHISNDCTFFHPSSLNLCKAPSLSLPFHLLTLGLGRKSSSLTCGNVCSPKFLSKSATIYQCFIYFPQYFHFPVWSRDDKWMWDDKTQFFPLDFIQWNKITQKVIRSHFNKECVQ